MTEKRLPTGREEGREAYRRQLEAAKRASMAQVLFKCARLVNERAIGVMRQRLEQPDLRVAHTTLFPHIELEGTRLTRLAERLGISKQAVGQMVDELEAMGLLIRAPDPSDGRAKLVRFVPGALTHGLGVLREVEAELARSLGADDMARLHAILLDLLAILEAGDGEEDGRSDPAR